MRQRLTSIVLALALIVPALVVLAAPPATATVFPNSASITLNNPPNTLADATPYPSTIAVSGLTGTVNHVAVTLSAVSYSHSQDIDALLVGPGGQSLIVVANLGPNGGAGAPASNSTLTLDDSGVVPPSGMATPWGSTSTFKPVNYGGFNETWGPPAPAGPYGDPGTTGTGATFASTFNGTNPNGTWSLYVITTAGGDGTGAIAGGWSLNVTTASAAAATTTTVNSNNNPSFTAAPGNSVTFTAGVHKASDNSAVNEGTVAFTDGGVTISGCAAVAVSAGQAACTTSFAVEGGHAVEAAYSGTANFGASNATVAQQVDDHTTVTGSSYCNTGSIALVNPAATTGNANPYPSHVFVSALAGAVNHVAVTLNGTTYSHSQDIDVLLVGPGGQSLILVANLGPNSGAGAPATNSTLTLDDNGTLPPSGMATPWGSSSTFKPVNYGGFNETWGPPAPAGPYGNPGPSGGGSATLGSTYNGTGANGTWSLYVITTAAGDGTGAIAGGWCATITTAAVAATTTMVASSNNPSFTTAPGNSVTLTATVHKASDNSAVNEGTVAFTDGGATISGCAAVAVSAGQATCTTAFTTEGGHAIGAAYSGTANFGASNAVLTQQVDDHTTVTTNNFCNTGSITLNNPAATNADAGPYPSHVFVTGLPGPLTHLSVTLRNTTYSHSQDIDALLVGPGGQSLILVADLGPTSGGGAPASNSTLTLDDNATLPPSGMTNPWGSSSTFKPVNYGGFNETWGPPAPAGPYGDPGTTGTGATLGSTYNGTSANGTWSLYVITTAAGDGTGAIAGGWCLGVQATPTIATQASAGVVAGGDITDTATLSGGISPTGTITFNLFGPGNAACTGPPIFISVKTVGGNGNYPSDPFTTHAPGTYQWRAAYSGDGANAPVSTACNANNESVVVTAATPTLVTHASAGVALGGTISDSATLAGGFNPTGSITFNLFGPGNATCTGPPVFTSTATVAGAGDYSSASFTPNSVGTYQFVASYSGDANNAGAASVCGDANESVVATPSAPTIVSVASAPVAAGGTISDTATLTGAVSPTGTITFTLFGPGDAACANVPPFTSTTPISANGSYSSAPFVVTVAGTYQFVASYSGDGNNAGATTACNDASETIVVSKASPAIASNIGPIVGTVTVGDSVKDTVTIAGGSTPSGQLTFTVFGPDDATCSGVGTTFQTEGGVGDGTFVSLPYTFTALGTYQFVASFGGDANNAAATTTCNDPLEQVTVNQATTSITSQASGPVTVGGTITDVATLNVLGGTTPTGSITFFVFGPGDAACSNVPEFASTTPVNGSGTYTSSSFSPQAPGTYVFEVNYSGDTDDLAATSPCGAANESVTVSQASPTVTTQASGPVTVGGTITDVANLAGGDQPTGSITFSGFGPGDATCSNIPAFTSTTPVNGNGTYTSSSFPAQAPGTYLFEVNYSGDTDNLAATSPCGAANESVVVTPGLPGYTPLVPVRICDTRAAGPGVAANQCDTHGHSPLSTGGILTLTAAGAAGVPADATAVVLHLTVTGTNTASYLTLWPTGQAKPVAASLNWSAGQTVGNLVQTGVGTGGQVSVFNYAGTADVIVDLAGYVRPSSGGLYVPLAPTRVCDTRRGEAANQCNTGASAGTLTPGHTRVVNVVSGFGVPAGATAVVLNVTATTTSAASYLDIWPDGSSQPLASSLSWAAGQTITNRVITAVSPSGNIDLANANGTTDVVIDLGGYYRATAPGSGYFPITPTRICDTRPVGPGVGANVCNSHGAGTLAAGGTLTLSGFNPIVTALVVNVTVTNTGATGFLVVYPADSARPSAPDIIWAPHQTIGNLVVANLGSTSAMDVFNGNLGSTDVVIDVVGYYSATSPPGPAPAAVAAPSLVMPGAATRNGAAARNNTATDNNAATRRR